MVVTQGENQKRDTAVVVGVPSIGILRRTMVMTGRKNEALRVTVHGREMGTGTRTGIEALRGIGIGREGGIETMKISMEGRETEIEKETNEGTVRVRAKGKGRKRACGEAEVDLKDWFQVSWMAETERRVAIGTIEAMEETRIRIMETEKGRGKQSNAIEKAPPDMVER